MNLEDRLTKLEGRRKPVTPCVWWDLRRGKRSMHLSTMTIDPIPPAAEWIHGLGWAMLDDESRRLYQATGQWSAADGLPRTPRGRLES